MPNSNNISLSTAPTSVVLKPKEIKVAQVEVSMIHQLRRHIVAIDDALKSINLKPLLEGAIITVLIETVYTWATTQKAPTAYLMIALILFGLSKIPRLNKEHADARHNVEEAKHDLQTIFEQSGINDNQESLSQ